MPLTDSPGSAGSKHALATGVTAGSTTAPMPRMVSASVLTTTFSRWRPNTRMVSPGAAASTAAWIESRGPTIVAAPAGAAAADPATPRVTGTKASQRRHRDQRALIATTVAGAPPGWALVAFISTSLKRRPPARDGASSRPQACLERRFGYGHPHRAGDRSLAARLPLPTRRWAVIDALRDALTLRIQGDRMP